MHILFWGRCDRGEDQKSRSGSAKRKRKVPQFDLQLPSAQSAPSQTEVLVPTGSLWFLLAPSSQQQQHRVSRRSVPAYSLGRVWFRLDSRLVGRVE